MKKNFNVWIILGLANTSLARARKKLAHEETPEVQKIPRQLAARSLILIILGCALFLKQLVWIFVVPVFQTPDEQAHFAQLQWLAENKNTNTDIVNNLSAEVATSEAVLGTLRDPFGNNKFTYHPEYKNPVVGTLSDRALPIFNLPIHYRTVYVGREAAMYPWLYYRLDLPFYNLVYKNSLIERVYVSRLLSLILGLGTAFVAFKIGQEIWGKGYKPIVLAILVGFQPMVSFVSAGIHPDNLLNLLYSLILWLCLLILKKGLKAKYLLALGMFLIAGYYTKFLIFLIIPVVGTVLVFRFFTQKLVGLLAAVAILLLPIIIFIFEPSWPFVPVVTSASPLAQMDFWQYLLFRGPKLFFEIWPWYWGVFRWLSLTLPLTVLKVITRIAILAGLGLVVKLVLAVKKRNFSFEFKSIILFLLSSLFFLLYLVLWDWRLMQSLGFSAGLQGRYFFPNIVAHMTLLMFGFSWGKFAKSILVTLGIAMMILNFIALRLVYLSYY